MKSISVLMFAVLAGSLFYQKWNRWSFQQIELDSLYRVGEEQKKPVETCLANEKCVFVYVAPWCPACHSFLKEFDLIKNMLAAKSVGMVIVIGAEKDEDKKNEMKARFPEFAVLDTNDNEFMKKHKVVHYPYFIVAGADRQVHYTDRKATEYIEERINSKTATQ